MAVTINASTSAGLVQTADTSGSLQLQTNSGTTAVTIDTSQNVGIGTTSPTRRLDVTSSGSTTCQIERTDGTYVLQLKGSGTTSVGALGMATNDMVMLTNGSERMRIDSSGRLLVGATTNWNASLFEVNSAVNGNQIAAFANAGSSTPYGLIMKYTAAAPNGTTNEFIYCNDTSAVRMTVRSNGGIANFSANNVNLSDIREKTNIELAGNYLDKVCAIPVKTFNYIDQNMEEDGGLTLGVIAQDVQSIAPELISESNWGTKEEPKERLSIYQTDLQYALMKSIQELSAKLDAQQQEINALKGVA